MYLRCCGKQLLNDCEKLLRRCDTSNHEADGLRTTGGEKNNVIWSDESGFGTQMVRSKFKVNSMNPWTQPASCRHYQAASDGGVTCGQRFLHRLILYQPIVLLPLATICHLLKATSSLIMHHVTKQKSSHTEFSEIQRLPQSPHLNPTENLRDVAEREIHSVNVQMTNPQKCCDAVVSTRSRISQERFQRLFESTPQRFDMGGTTRHWYGGSL